MYGIVITMPIATENQIVTELRRIAMNHDGNFEPSRFALRLTANRVFCHDLLQSSRSLRFVRMAHTELGFKKPFSSKLIGYFPYNLK